MFKLLIIVILSYINGYGNDYKHSLIYDVINTVSILNMHSDKSLLVNIDYRVMTYNIRELYCNRVPDYTINCTIITIIHLDLKSNNDVDCIMKLKNYIDINCRSPS